jgi:hypothetical protein
MAEQLPESMFERMSAKERAKERLERQKMLDSLPKGTLEQNYMAFAAGLNVDIQASLEDLLLLAHALPEVPAPVLEAKNRLVQASRRTLEKTSRAYKIALIAAKEGPDSAQRIFNPEPTSVGKDGEETKMLEKIQKEKEAAKKVQ